jgi:DNA-binding XRE family transcriptional regulator
MTIVAQERTQAKAQAPPERTLSDVFDAVTQLRDEVAALREMLAPIALYAPTMRRIRPVVLPVVMPQAAGDVAGHAPNGTALRQRRFALGLSQRELSAAAHVGRSTVAELERGKRHSIALRLHLTAVLDRLAAAAAERPPA